MPLVPVRKRPVPQQATNAGVHLPAPTGGINAFDPASAMPTTDCLSLYNMIPYQYGLRVRSGWREWATNVWDPSIPDSFGVYDDGSPMEFPMSAPLGGREIGAWTGLSGNSVRTILAFYGSITANDRIFACTGDGIYDVTRPTSSPQRVYQFPVGTHIGTGGDLVQSATAGYGSYTSFATPYGHFLAYCDGANGYLLYSESTNTWTKVVEGDGTDGASIKGANPDKFRHVTSWKHRLWFAEEGESTGWYLPAYQETGTVSPKYFGAQFRYGGELVGVFSWTVDGGTGIDDLLVAISRGGDLVMYRGTDPDFEETFGLQGVWWVGQIPPGRNIASDFGGDLFILSRLGCLPLSKLVSGGLIRDPTLYASAKISNLFNRLMTERGHLYGWNIKMHPSDNLLIVTVPATPDKPQQQLAMSLATKGWAQHTGVPMTCLEAFRGTLYFGTNDGRVCVNDGFVDDARLDGTQGYAIDCSLLTAYNNIGSAQKKRVHIIKAYFSTDGTRPGYSLQARYDFDLLDLQALPVAATSPSNAWDVMTWDDPKWGVGTGKESRFKGATGIGTNVAIVCRFTTKTSTTLIGFDAVYDAGGYL